MRLALVIALVSALAVAAGGLIFVTILSDRLHNSLSSELRSKADTVAQLVQQVAPGAGASAMPDLSDTASMTQVLDRAGRAVDSSGVDPSVTLLSRAQLARALAGATTFERVLPAGGSPTLVLAEPVGDAKPYVVVVGTSLLTVNSAVSQVEAVFVVGGIAAVLLAGLATWLLAGAALRPVDRMRREAAEISALNGPTKLKVPDTHDEIAALALTLNELLTRLQDTLQVQRSFVAAAGHELRTPLAILKAELELAGRPGRSKDELVAAVESAADETNRLVHLAQDLLVLAQSEGAGDFVRPTSMDLVPFVEGVVDAHASRAARAGISLVQAGPSTLGALADGARLRQAIDNVLDNALRFGSMGSTITISLADDYDMALIDIADEGPGIDPAYLPRAFERFSRPDDGRDRAEGGAGLGLSIVQSIVLAHDGRVHLVNRAEGGLQVLIRIPASGPPARPSQPRSEPVGRT